MVLSTPLPKFPFVVSPGANISFLTAFPSFPSYLLYRKVHSLSQTVSMEENDAFNQIHTEVGVSGR